MFRRVVAVKSEPANANDVGKKPLPFYARLVGSPWFWIAFVACGFALPIVRSLVRTIPPAPPTLGQLAPFELVDQDGKVFGSNELANHVFVVDFARLDETDHTRELGNAMAKVRYRARNLSNVFHLVTITLDPSRDVDLVRANYAERFHASTAAWSFLGGGQEAVATVLAQFRITLAQAPDFDESTRREKIVLIDQRGRIRGYYNHDDGGLDALMADVGMVANEGP